MIFLKDFSNYKRGFDTELEWWPSSWIENEINSDNFKEFSNEKPNLLTVSQVHTLAKGLSEADRTLRGLFYGANTITFHLTPILFLLFKEVSLNCRLRNLSGLNR